MFKVLIVEDEKLQREGFRRSFPWQTYNCVVEDCAANGNEGLEKIKRLKPDIVFTDVKMPLMDGITMLEKAKETQPSLRSVILTGYAEFEYARRAVSLGVDAYLLKPVDSDEFGKVMGKLVSELDKARDEEAPADLRELIPGFDSCSAKVRFACMYVVGHYPEKVTGAVIAKALGISTDYLYRLFKSETGMLLRTLLTDYRIKQACRMLEEQPQYKVYEIAYAVGFSDYKYFHTVFTGRMGVSPVEYQKGAKARGEIQ